MAPMGIWKSRLALAGVAPLLVTESVKTAAGAALAAGSFGTKLWYENSVTVTSPKAGSVTARRPTG